MHYLAMQLGQVCDIKLCNAFALFLLRVGSEGRPESEVRRRVGVELTEYTEEGNG